MAVIREGGAPGLMAKMMSGKGMEAPKAAKAGKGNWQKKFEKGVKGKKVC